MENKTAYDIIQFAEGYLGVPLVQWQREMLLAVYNKSKDMKKPHFIFSRGQWQLIDLDEGSSEE